MKQSLSFPKPVFCDDWVTATITVSRLFSKKKIAVLSTVIFDIVNVVFRYHTRMLHVYVGVKQLFLFHFILTKTLDIFKIYKVH